MNVLAIDPGTKTGFAHSAGRHGTWDFSGHVHAGGAAWALITEVLALGEELGIDRIVTEAGFAGNFRGKTTLEAMRAAVQIAAFRLGSVPVRMINPGTLKLYSVGHGQAPKPLVMRACIDRLGIVPIDDNHSDAVWMLHMARVNKPADRISLPAKPKKRKAKAPTQAEAYRASDQPPRKKKSADKDSHLFPF